jgi:hypothetical protein
MVLAKGHHPETRRTARNFLFFSLTAVCQQDLYIIFVTGEDDIAGFDSQRYRYKQVGENVCQPARYRPTRTGSTGMLAQLTCSRRV